MRTVNFDEKIFWWTSKGEGVKKKLLNLKGTTQVHDLLKLFVFIVGVDQR